MFKLIIKISWSSLKQRGARSLMVILMISMSLWGLLFMEGIYDGMTEQLIANAIRSDSGHITLFARGYRTNKELSKLIIDNKYLTDVLTPDPRIQSFSARILQEGLVATAQYSRNCRIIGINLKDEQKHGRLDKYLIEGSYNFGKKSKGAIIGSKLADKLKVSVGKKIIISGQDIDNEVSSLALKIKGILRTNNMGLDDTAVFIDRDIATKMFSITTGVSKFSILVNNEDDIADLQSQLQSTLPQLEVFRWDEMYPALLQSRVMMKGFNTVTNIIVFCIAGLGIFGVMLVSVMERLREFGILLAVGTAFRHICWMVISESLFLGIIGFIGGSTLGGTTLYYFLKKGLDLTMFSEGLEAFGIDTIIYAIIRPEYFFYSFTAVILATLISTILPLRILNRAKPIEAIHNI